MGGAVRRYQLELGSTELRRDEGDRRGESAYQGARDRLPSGLLTWCARGELTAGASARSESGDARQRARPDLRIRRGSESTGDSGTRGWSIRAPHAANGSDAAVGNGREAAEHHMQALHVAGDSVHGAAQPEQPG